MPKIINLKRKFYWSVFRDINTVSRDEMEWSLQQCCLCDAAITDSSARGLWSTQSQRLYCRALIHHFLLLCLAGRKWPGHFRLMVSDWSEENVLAWLREEGLESFVDTFKANNIDGAELLSLSKESLSSELHIGDTTHIYTLHPHSLYPETCSKKHLHRFVVQTVFPFPVKAVSEMVHYTK